MTNTLNEIRQKIDAIDNNVHDLLMERAALVSSVAAAKKKDGMQIVQPAREARLMRRLLGRHHGPLPKDTIVRIWRELIGSVQLLQTGLNVAVSADENADRYWDMAKNYFGSAVPMQKVQGYQNAVAAVRDGDVSFAVLPWPEFDGGSPWWANLLNRNGADTLSIVCSLPYCDEIMVESSDLRRAVVISQIEFLPSDDDITFIALEVDKDISRARVKDVAEKVGIQVHNAYSATLSHAGDVKALLLEVSGFYPSGDDACSQLKNELGKACYYCDAIGGYPVVPDISEQTQEQGSAA